MARIDTPAQRVALGPIAPLPADLRRALTGQGFSPLPAPGESDWLANHSERGQTFADFVGARRATPDAARRTLYLLPLGDPAPAPAPAADALLAALTAFYALPARLLPRAPLSKLLPGSRINKRTGKRQLFTPRILATLKRRLPDDAFALAAITAEDLYPDEAWNFVFGQASLRERVGVFSFARYDPAFHDEPRGADAAALVLRRAIKVLLHEVGHMFGVRHCIFFACLMNGSNHLEETDAQPAHVCPVCLRKLQHSIGFDVARRYEALERFFTQVGLVEEAAWSAARLAEIRAPG